MRDAWAGRIELQAVVARRHRAARSTRPISTTLIADGRRRMAASSARVTYAVPDLDAGGRHAGAPRRASRGLDLDLHVDETRRSGSATRCASSPTTALAHRLRRPDHRRPLLLARRAGRRRRSARMDARRRGRHRRRLAADVQHVPAGPRAPARTPRWRGVTLLHEMMARGVPGRRRLRQYPRPVLCLWRPRHARGVARGGRASSISTIRSSTWAAASPARRPRSSAATPIRRASAPGRAADLVLFRARSWTELLARPQADRTVLRAGRRSTGRCPTIANSTTSGNGMMTGLCPSSALFLYPPSNHRQLANQTRSPSPLSRMTLRVPPPP